MRVNFDSVKRACLWLVVAAFCAVSAQAQSYETVHGFSAGVYQSYASGRLLTMPDGTFYGSARAGSVFEKGSIFILTPDGPDHLAYLDLHSFSGIDGSQPQEAIVGADGAIYGTTLAGGAGDAGTIFRHGSFGPCHPAERLFRRSRDVALRPAPRSGRRLLRTDGGRRHDRRGHGLPGATRPRPDDAATAAAHPAKPHNHRRA